MTTRQPTRVPPASAGSERRDNLVRLDDYQASLPSGVSPGDWATERAQRQNPRIRSFLTAIRLLEDVHDSNYALLHCSPQRLEQIWRQVAKVARLIRGDLAGSLEGGSRVPALETALRRSHLSLRVLMTTALDELDRYPAVPEAAQLPELRKVLCVSIGKIHSFLQDTFCQVMAADPRSRHGPDYFLSKRFPKDLEEAEWLHSSVNRLREYLDKLEQHRYRHLSELEVMLRREQVIPAGPVWEEIGELLREFKGLLTAMLKEILALRGIRFDELEALDRYAFEIPARCHMLIELYETAQQVAEEVVARARSSDGAITRRIDELTASHAVLSRRMADLLDELDRSFRDLMAFVPLWLENIELRRALLLTRKS